MNGLRVGCFWNKHMLKVQRHLREHPILRALLPGVKHKQNFCSLCLVIDTQFFVFWVARETKKGRKWGKSFQRVWMLPLSKKPQLFSQRKKFPLISCLPDTLGIFSWCFMRKWVDLLEGAFRQIAHTVASVRTCQKAFFWGLCGYICLSLHVGRPSLSGEEHTIHSPGLKPVSTDYTSCEPTAKQKTGPSHAPNPASNLITLSKLSLVWLSWFSLDFCQLRRTKACYNPLCPLSHPPQSQSFW
jgi:hypothetical protein